MGTLVCLKENTKGREAAVVTRASMWVEPGVIGP